MRFRLCVVGRPRDPALAAAIAEYEGRAGRYWPLEVREVRAHSGDGGPARESQRLLAAAGDARMLLCDEGGRSFTSREFASWLQGLREDARDVAFMIGGAAGVAPELHDRAELRVALAPWTLPHELARLVLAEQLYRAGTILRGEPYHK